jgi:hypothetical protein
MLIFHRLRDIISEKKTSARGQKFLSLEDQVDGWARANKKMAWGILDIEFAKLKAAPSPVLTNADRDWGFNGIALFYGFGDDGLGNADSILSGKLAWEFATKFGNNKTWQCGYIDFRRPKDIRLRSGSPARPKGFYYGKIHLGHKYQEMTVSQLHRHLNTETGCGPEGLQLLSITHCHLVELMNKRRIPFMSLADYEVAPRGVNDFFDAPQIFCSDNRLGLGIGNVERNYPLFGIPTLRFAPGRMADK